LYLNKRWDYSSLVCSKCSSLYKCPNCDSSLSIHDDFMICHICNYMRKVPIKCDKCNSTELQKIWVWTKQIEKFLIERYKNINIFRFDTDVVKNRSEKKEALWLLRNAQIIVWTKMIVTGFDFENVWLVWVILLEQELQIPKYNTSEKVYSNLKQLLWRWWRKWEKTEFVIQTFIPENEIVKDIAFSNYKEFFTKTLKERKAFNYPPFCELAILEYRDKDKEKALNFIIKIKEKLENELKAEKLKGLSCSSQVNGMSERQGKSPIVEIILNPNYLKKYNQFYYKIILKWYNLRDFLKCIKTEIFLNSNFSVIFD
jgi:primosomal protein N' (replication factor Y)